MPLSLKPHHLQRYREIARLLVRYGRSDLLARSGLENVGIEDAAAASAGPGGSPPRVHDRPGEVLRAQRRRQLNGREEAPAIEPPHTPADELNQRAEQLARDLESMGPTFVKVGQFLSTRPDLLPTPYLEALARLQDHVEPVPFADVERTIAEDLRTRVGKAFAEFDETPVASASLGQVHRAILPSGRMVAVKVQRPGIRDQLLADLDVFAELAEFIDAHTDTGRRHGFAGMVDELRRSLLRELDYRQEARHLAVLDENLAEFERIIVPRPVDDYVTPRVLTMEFVRGRKVTSLGALARLELDGAPLADELTRAYLKQILVDGFFHADPHPGNVLLTDDGRIALLDLGMVAMLAPGMQDQMLKLVLAVSEGRGEDAGALVTQIGIPIGEAAQPDAVKRRVAEMVVEFQGLRLREIALGRMLFESARVAGDGGFRMPRELTLLSKTLLNVDEVARRLDPEFDPNAAMRRHAAEILQRRMLHSFSPGKVFAGVLEMKELAEQLPRRINQLLTAVAESRLRIKVDALDEVLLMEGLQKIANRITLGLVISAMIVGAALLMRIETPYRILGYPALAIVFFMVAAVTGVLLIANILLNDLKAEKQRLRARQKRDRMDEPVGSA